MRSTLKTLVACTSLALLAGLARADTLEMVDSPSADAARPSRGMSMSRVESRFGEPVQRIAAVGDPPITRWEYPGFVVYFEYDKVIHAVAVR